MTPFEIAFPGYLQACANLFQSLLPFALFILVLGMALEFWTAPPSPDAAIITLTKSFLILLLLLRSGDLLNEGQALVKSWVETNIPGRPENVAERYRQKLREVQQSGDRADESFLQQILQGDYFEAIILAILTLISWLAMGLLALVYSVQKAVLLGAWALSPLLLPCMAIPQVSGIGLLHLLRLIAILLWPVGLALAATFTDGLLDAMASGAALGNNVVGEAIGRGLVNLLGIALLAIWIVGSTFFAPIFIHRLITGSAGPASFLGQAGHYATLGFQVVQSMIRSVRSGFSQSPSGSFGAAASTAPSTPGVPSISSANPTAASAPAPPWPPSDPVGDAAVRTIVDEHKRS